MVQSSSPTGWEMSRVLPWLAARRSPASGDCAPMPASRTPACESTERSAGVEVANSFSVSTASVKSAASSRGMPTV